MTAIQLINAARQLTLDSEPSQQTWTDREYLLSLNEARAYLFSRYPEARVTAVVGLTAYSDISETDLADTMTEDDVYFPFFVRYLACRFFESDPRSSINADMAKMHQNGWQRALGQAGRR